MGNTAETQSSLTRLEHLNAIGVALSAEPDNKKLLEMILLGAKEITNADGGTLYTLTEDNCLKFEIMRNKTLGIAMGGTTGQEITFAPLPLYLGDGSKNINTVAAYAALNDQTVNIENAYQSDQFDFSGSRKFDEKTGYRSQSFLTIPMKDHNHQVIGVLQLINALDVETKQIIPFSADNQRLVESLASQAAVAMTNHNLIEGLKALFEGFVELIAEAIDKKSPYTGGHCRRVPELTLMLAQAALDSQAQPFQSFAMTEAEFYELKVASWLHDCGKVTTPEHIMDKSTKLSTIFDRMELVEQRFELLKKQAECRLLQQKIDDLIAGKPVDALEAAHLSFIEKCEQDCDFLRKANIGKEFMTPEDQARVVEIGQYQIQNAQGEWVPFLSENEIYNLTIQRGTLTKEERTVINDHIVVTIDMLNSLPYPKELRRIPEYAGGHHERMDGTGYPKGLTREQMSIPARIMCIADIFEALTSKDRPYKKAKTLTESLTILGRMKLDGHVDPDLFDLFVREKIYLKYAQQFLEPEQIDAVDEAKIPGYTPM